MTDRLIEEQAAAWREIAPYLGRLHLIGQRLGWRLGGLLIKSAVEELERLATPAAGPPVCPTCGLPMRGLACLERFGATRPKCPQL